MKFDTGDGIFRFAIKKEDERIRLSPKRAILLHSDTQSIDELQAFMEVKDVT